MNLQKKLSLLLLALLASGCANQAQFLAGQQAAVDVAEKLADEQIAVATFNLCKVPTIGAWMRKYGSDPVKADAWRTLCAPVVTQTPANGK